MTLRPILIVVAVLGVAALLPDDIGTGSLAGAGDSNSPAGRSWTSIEHQPAKPQ